jgi:hypothetical protein
MAQDLVPAEGDGGGLSGSSLSLCSAVQVTLPSSSSRDERGQLSCSRGPKRLRKAMGNPHLRSQSDTDARYHTVKATLIMRARAFTLTFPEPGHIPHGSVLRSSVRGAVYLVLVVPHAFSAGYYGFNPGQQGLVFLGILVVVCWDGGGSSDDYPVLYLRPGPATERRPCSRALSRAKPAPAGWICLSKRMLLLGNADPIDCCQVVPRTR